MLIICLLFASFRLLQGAPLKGWGDETAPSAPLHNAHLAPRSDIVLGHRQTSDILISCLVTIFACTWTAIHPNIPAPTEARWDTFKKKSVTTVYALLAPEFITIWALRQHLGAKRIVEEYNRDIAHLNGAGQAEATDAEQQLGLARASLPARVTISAKAWLLHVPRRLTMAVHGWLVHSPPVPLPLNPGQVRPWTITHGFFVQMGGFMLCESRKPIQAMSFSKAWIEADQDMMEYATTKQVRPSDGMKEFIKSGTIEPPMVTQAEIEDCSKGDFISKTVVVLQTTWFVAQCIARWSARISVSELEIVTLGFAMLNAITYGLWWNKPQNVSVPIYLEIQTTSTVNTALPKKSFLPQKIEDDWKSSTGIEFIYLLAFRLIQAGLRPLYKLNGPRYQYVRQDDLRVPMFFAEPGGTAEVHFLAAICMLFGCVHLIPAWSIDYTSHTEKWLWWTSSTFITGEPILVFIFNKSQYKPAIHTMRWFDFIIVPIYLLAGVGLPLYLVARVIIIVLALSSLRDLPLDVFLAIDWLSSIPHL